MELFNTTSLLLIFLLFQTCLPLQFYEDRKRIGNWVTEPVTTAPASCHWPIITLEGQYAFPAHFTIYPYNVVPKRNAYRFSNGWSDFHRFSYLKPDPVLLWKFITLPNRRLIKRCPPKRLELKRLCSPVWPNRGLQTSQAAPYNGIEVPSAHKKEELGPSLPQRHTDRCRSSCQCGDKRPDRVTMLRKALIENQRRERLMKLKELIENQKLRMKAKLNKLSYNDREYLGKNAEQYPTQKQIGKSLLPVNLHKNPVEQASFIDGEGERPILENGYDLQFKSPNFDPSSPVNLKSQNDKFHSPARQNEDYFDEYEGDDKFDFNLQKGKTYGMIKNNKDFTLDEIRASQNNAENNGKQESKYSGQGFPPKLEGNQKSSTVKLRFPINGVTSQPVVSHNFDSNLKGKLEYFPRRDDKNKLSNTPNSPNESVKSQSVLSPNKSEEDFGIYDGEQFTNSKGKSEGAHSKNLKNKLNLPGKSVKSEPITSPITSEKDIDFYDDEQYINFKGKSDLPQKDVKNKLNSLGESAKSETIVSPNATEKDIDFYDDEQYTNFKGKSGLPQKDVKNKLNSRGESAKSETIVSPNAAEKDIDFYDDEQYTNFKGKSGLPQKDVKNKLNSLGESAKSETIVSPNAAEKDIDFYDDEQYTNFKGKSGLPQKDVKNKLNSLGESAKSETIVSPNATEKDIDFYDDEQYTKLKGNLEGLPSKDDKNKLNFPGKNTSSFMMSNTLSSPSESVKPQPVLLSNKSEKDFGIYDDEQYTNSKGKSQGSSDKDLKNKLNSPSENVTSEPIQSSNTSEKDNGFYDDEQYTTLKVKSEKLPVMSKGEIFDYDISSKSPQALVVTNSSEIGSQMSNNIAITNNTDGSETLDNSFQPESQTFQANSLGSYKIDEPGISFEHEGNGENFTEKIELTTEDKSYQPTILSSTSKGEDYSHDNENFTHIKNYESKEINGKNTVDNFQSEQHQISTATLLGSPTDKQDYEKTSIQEMDVALKDVSPEPTVSSLSSYTEKKDDLILSPEFQDYEETSTQEMDVALKDVSPEPTVSSLGSPTDKKDDLILSPELQDYEKTSTQEMDVALKDVSPEPTVSSNTSEKGRVHYHNEGFSSIEDNMRVSTTEDGPLLGLDNESEQTLNIYRNESKLKEIDDKDKIVPEEKKQKENYDLNNFSVILPSVDPTKPSAAYDITTVIMPQQNLSKPYYFNDEDMHNKSSRSETLIGNDITGNEFNVAETKSNISNLEVSNVDEAKDKDMPLGLVSPGESAMLSHFNSEKENFPLLSSSSDKTGSENEIPLKEQNPMSNNGKMNKCCPCPQDTSSINLSKSYDFTPKHENKIDISRSESYHPSQGEASAILKSSYTTTKPSDVSYLQDHEKISSTDLQTLNDSLVALSQSEDDAHTPVKVEAKDLNLASTFDSIGDGINLAKSSVAAISENSQNGKDLFSSSDMEKATLESYSRETKTPNISQHDGILGSTESLKEQDLEESDDYGYLMPLNFEEMADYFDIKTKDMDDKVSDKSPSIANSKVHNQDNEGNKMFPGLISKTNSIVKSDYDSKDKLFPLGYSDSTSERNLKSIDSDLAIEYQGQKLLKNDAMDEKLSEDINLKNPPNVNGDIANSEKDSFKMLSYSNDGNIEEVTLNSKSIDPEKQEQENTILAPFAKNDLTDELSQSEGEGMNNLGSVEINPSSTTGEVVFSNQVVTMDGENNDKTETISNGTFLAREADSDMLGNVVNKLPIVPRVYHTSTSHFDIISSNKNNVDDELRTENITPVFLSANENTPLYKALISRQEELYGPEPESSSRHHLNGKESPISIHPANDPDYEYEDKNVILNNGQHAHSTRIDDELGRTITFKNSDAPSLSKESTNKYEKFREIFESSSEKSNIDYFPLSQNGDNNNYSNIILTSDQDKDSELNDNVTNDGHPSESYEETGLFPGDNGSTFSNIGPDSSQLETPLQNIFMNTLGDHDSEGKTNEFDSADTFNSGDEKMFKGHTWNNQLSTMMDELSRYGDDLAEDIKSDEESFPNIFPVTVGKNSNSYPGLHMTTAEFKDALMGSSGQRNNIYSNIMSTLAQDKDSILDDNFTNDGHPSESYWETSLFPGDNGSTFSNIDEDIKSDEESFPNFFPVTVGKNSNSYPGLHMTTAEFKDALMGSSGQRNNIYSNIMSTLAQDKESILDDNFTNDGHPPESYEETDSFPGDNGSTVSNIGPDSSQLETPLQNIFRNTLEDHASEGKTNEFDSADTFNSGDEKMFKGHTWNNQLSTMMDELNRYRDDLSQTSNRPDLPSPTMSHKISKKAKVEALISSLMKIMDNYMREADNLNPTDDQEEFNSWDQICEQYIIERLKVIISIILWLRDNME